jgi:protein O-GlcNAc transferase
MLTHTISQVNALMQSGQFASAEATCRSVLASQENAELRNLLGIICARLGRALEGIEHLETACRLDPRNPSYFTNLGSVFGMTGQSSKSAECFRRAIAIKPSLAEAHYNLGNAEKDQRHFDVAVTAYRKATQLNPSHAAAWSNLGGALFELDRIEDGAAALRRALSINPSLASALTNLGTIHLYRGELKAAIDCNQRALALNPRNADALRNLGAVALVQLNYQEALQRYHQAVELNPNSVALLYELANAQNTVYLQDQLVDTLQKILSLRPDDARAWRMLGALEMERGNIERAQTVFSDGKLLSGDFAIRVRSVLSLPPIVESVEHIRRIRAGLMTGLAELESNPGTLDDPYSQLATNFFLAYHGLSTKEFHERISSLYRQCAPTVAFESPHSTSPPKKNSKLRIGFYSKFIYKHSVSTSFSRVVEALSSREDVEIYIISTTTHDSEKVRQVYGQFRGAFVFTPTHLPVAHALIASLELDFLVYLDLGMDPFSYLLAHARLARKQCVMGGHPDTSGVSTVDYYLSAKGLELEGAQAEYSEQLIELESGGFSLSRPSTNLVKYDRAQLGLPQSGKIYLCPMMLQKLHPDFDDIIGRLLQSDGQSQVILFGSPFPNRWVELLSKRLDRSVPASVRDRIVFHPWIEDAAQFTATVAASDVVLDPLHFGIGTTTAITAAGGTPYVTLPGQFARGRVGQYFAKMLKVGDDCIATSPEDYVNKAVAIANDRTLRDHLARTIMENNEALYDNHANAAADLYNFFVRASEADN